MHSQTIDCLVNVNGLPVRKGPGRNYAAITKLRKKTKIKILGLTEVIEKLDGKIATWYEIIINNTIRGYAFGAYITCKGKDKGFPKYLTKTTFPFDITGMSFNLSKYCLGDTGSGYSITIIFKKNNIVVFNSSSGISTPSYEIKKRGKYKINDDIVKITWDYTKIVKKYYEKPEFNNTKVEKKNYVELFYMVKCISKKINKKYFNQFDDCYGLYSNKYRTGEYELLVLETRN